MDDEVAMLNVKLGELEGLDLLYRRHSNPLFGFFYGMCRDRSLSEDLVQEVFWRILRYRETFDEKMAFKSWLYRIARNLYIDRIRQLSRRNSIDIDSLDEHPDPEAKTGYHESVLTDDKKRLLLALDSLSEEQREILVLSRFEGHSFKSIASILNCSEGTAKVRAFRALQALKSAFHSKKGIS